MFSHANSMLDFKITKLSLLGNHDHDNNQLLLASKIRNCVQWEPTIDCTHANYAAVDENFKNEDDNNIKRRKNCENDHHSNN